MIAGVPGAGINALFYLLCVLAMPFVALLRVVRAGSLGAGRWRLVARQVAIGLGIVAGLLVGGTALVLLATSTGPQVTAEQTAQLAHEVDATFSRIGIAFGVATLVVVLGTVQLLAFVEAVRSRRTITAAATGPLAPAWSTTEIPGGPGDTDVRRALTSPRD